METLGNNDSKVKNKLQKFLIKMSNPIQRKDRKEIKKYKYIHNLLENILINLPILQFTIITQLNG